MTRADIEQKFIAVIGAYGQPMTVGIQLFKEYVDAVLDYIDERTK